MVDDVNRRTHARRRGGRAAALAALAFGTIALPAGSAQAASPIPLVAADSFALLAGSTIANTGVTTISGDIGLCCTGVALTGFGPAANRVIQPGGAQYVGPGGVAAIAQNDLDIAYANAAGQPVTNTVPVDLSLTGTPANPLLPGVYESTAHGAMQINTGLTLDFQGNPNAVFIFQATTLATAAGPGGSVKIVNGGATPSACNIYWQLSDATQGVTLGTASAFKGTTMALGASVLGTAATVEGRILTRRSKAVTLDTNTITRTACAGASSGGGTGTTAPTGSTGTTPPAGAGLPGTAHLSGPSGPVSGPFTVAVTGDAIRTVTFYLDGRRVSTVHAKPGRKRFTLKIDPRGQSHRLHRVTARVTFTTASGRTRTARSLTYRRVSAPPPVPRFTG